MSKALRIVFLGTPDFAVESLKNIHESGRKIVGVITAPDRKAGRGQKLQQSAVKQYAESQGLKVLQPTNLKDADFQAELKALKADIQIVVAFRMLPESVWNMPPMGTFNLHASLLPKYRGAAPINWAIINGEKESGVTTFFLKHEIDTGDLLFQEAVSIDDRETAGSLHDKLMLVGGKLVVKTLEAIESEDYETKAQDDFVEGKTPVAPKIFREDCAIDWNKSATEVDRLIRGLSPYPAAWTSFENKENGKKLNVKIYDAIPNDAINLEAASLKVEQNKLFIGCSDRALEVKVLQVAGKKRMETQALLNGFNPEEFEIAEK